MPNVGERERKNIPHRLCLVGVVGISPLRVRTRKKKGAHWDAAAERRLNCLIIIFPRDTGLLCVWCSGPYMIPQPRWKRANNHFVISARGKWPVKASLNYCKGLHIFPSCALCPVCSPCGCIIRQAPRLLWMSLAVQKRCHLATVTWNQWSTVRQKLAFGLSVSRSVVWSLDRAAKFSPGADLFPFSLHVSAKNLTWVTVCSYITLNPVQGRVPLEPRASIFDSVE